MSDARTEILEAIRSGRAGSRSAHEIESRARELASRAGVTRPRFHGDPLGRFTARLTAAGATVARVAAPGDVPGATRAYLARFGLPPVIALAPAPELTALDWHGFTTTQAIDRNQTAAVSRAELAVAETGTLVFCSGPASPETFGFQPLHHVAVVHARDVVAYLEDAFAALRRRAGGLPRATNLVSGPSGTADIEATSVRGAHGPEFLHAIVVG